MCRSIKLFSILLTVSLFAASCQKSGSKIITKGSWMVSLFMEDNKDETSDFFGYTFDFNSDGTLMVTLPTGIINTGRWSYDDNSSKYKIMISRNDKLDKVNDEWIIVSKSNDLIELKDDSSTKNELLNFKKK
jgi:hypothetical protein